MAWTDVCKVNFKSACIGLTLKKRISVNSALKQFSKESGIPLKTLQRWWFELKIEEENVLKNEAVSKDIENNEDNEKEESNSHAPNEETDEFICRVCGKNSPPYITCTGKPVSQKSKYFGLCSSCRMKAVRTKDSNGDGLQTVCPHCGGGHSIPWSTVESRLNTHNKTREEQNGKS